MIGRYTCAPKVEDILFDQVIVLKDNSKVERYGCEWET